MSGNYVSSTTRLLAYTPFALRSKSQKLPVLACVVTEPMSGNFSCGGLFSLPQVLMDDVASLGEDRP